MMENQHSTIHVDSSGDLSLIAEQSVEVTRATIAKTFIVSTKVLCLASPVWKATFDPEGPWAKQSSSSEGFKMLEDDPDALLILLDAAHLNFDRVPKEVNLKQMLQLSILCDKYDVFRLIRPWIADWIESLQRSSKVCDRGNEDWLFISWSFGFANIYNSLSKHLVSSVWLNGEGNCTIQTGKKLGDNFPPGAYESIMNCRSRTIEALLQLCVKLVGTYIYQPRVCQVVESTGGLFSKPMNAEACDALVLGSLIRGLSSSGLWPIPENPEDVNMSVTKLSKKLLEITCYTWQATTMNTSTGAAGFGVSASPALSVRPSPFAGFSTAGSSPTPTQVPTNPPRQTGGLFGSGSSSGSFGQSSTTATTPGKLDANNAHQKCDFTTSLRADVRRILDDMESGVLDEHREHLAEQEKKSYWLGYMSENCGPRITLWFIKYPSSIDSQPKNLNSARDILRILGFEAWSEEELAVWKKRKGCSA